MTTEERTAAIEASGARPRDKNPGIIGISPLWAELEGLMTIDEETFLATMATFKALNDGVLKKAKDEEAAVAGISASNITESVGYLNEAIHSIREVSRATLTPTHKHALERALLQLGETRDMIGLQVPATTP